MRAEAAAGPVSPERATSARRERLFRRVKTRALAGARYVERLRSGILQAS